MGRGSTACCPRCLHPRLASRASLAFGQRERTLGRMNRLGLMACLSGLLLAGCGQSGSASRPVRHEREGYFTYQNFVANWEHSISSAQYACLRTIGEYDRIYYAAGTMGALRPYGPPESFFSDRQMLMVCRTSPGDSSGTLFTLQDVREAEGEITVAYAYAGRTDLTGLKDTLNVYVPKRDYARVRFVENGRLVQVLDLRGGQWAVPPAHPAIK